MNAVAELRLLTVQDYHRMVELGILAADERVELLEGQLFKMAAKGTAHSAAITRIERVLLRQLAGQVLLRLQDPVRLNNFSEPEPDIAIVQIDPLDYEDHHPMPSEIFWLIEVADTTLKRDRELKAPSYSQSQIREYWILDVPERRLFVFRQPGLAGYGSEQILTERETIAPLAFPDCQIKVRDFLRPAQQ